MLSDTIHQQISVAWNFPVTFTDGLFNPANPVLAQTLNRLGEGGTHRALVFVDAFVAEKSPQLSTQIEQHFAAHAESMSLAGPVEIVPGGEAIKNDFALAERLARGMLEARLDRHAFVIIVGGGAVLDAVGFAAALVHRGLRVVRVPTTVLAQNDAGVGVKNGVNYLATG